MTVDEIASFCEYRDCQVAAGNPESGFLKIDGRGIDRNLYTYGRFNMFGEVRSPASPQRILESASHFRIRRGESVEELDRSAFEAELERFQRLVQD